MTDTLTPARLAEIEALAKKATPGPWTLGLVANVCSFVNSGKGVIARCDEENHVANSAYIAALDPQTVLALLASHAALVAEVERLRAELYAFGQKYDAEDKRVDAVMRDLEQQLTTAREAGAREMRERCAKICESKGLIASIEAAATIRALPLTPAAEGEG